MAEASKWPEREKGREQGRFVQAYKHFARILLYTDVGLEPRRVMAGYCAPHTTGACIVAQASSGDPTAHPTILVRGHHIASRG